MIFYMFSFYKITDILITDKRSGHGAKVEPEPQDPGTWDPGPPSKFQSGTWDPSKV